jgi:hypothetical protein
MFGQVVHGLVVLALAGAGRLAVVAKAVSIAKE